MQIFLTQLAIKRPLRFPPHPMCASALPGENGTHEIGVDMNKESRKNIPDVIDCNFKMDCQILIVFDTSIPDTRPPNDCSSSDLTQRLLLHYLQKTKQAKYALKWTENVNKFHLSGSVDPNSPDLSPFAYNVCSVIQQRVYQTPFRNADELKVTGWSLEQNIIDTAINECVCTNSWYFEYFL